MPDGSSPNSAAARPASNDWLGAPLPVAGSGSGAPSAHPSRSAPRCVDCSHHLLRGGIRPACNHPSQPVHVDDGAPWVPLLVARVEQDRCAREGLFFCGPSALGFLKRGETRQTSTAADPVMVQAELLVADASQQLLKAAGLLPEPQRSRLLAAASSLRSLG